MFTIRVVFAVPLSGAVNTARVEKKHYHAIHTIQYSKIIYKARMVNQMAESEATVDI